MDTHTLICSLAVMESMDFGNEVLPYVSKTRRNVLLVTTKRDETKWVIPGGGVEPGEDVCAAAIREVMEEAGVRGVITRYLGVFETKDDRHRTSVFVMRVSEELYDWEDSRRMDRKRCWFPVGEARVLLGLHKRSQQVYLDCLKRLEPIESSSADSNDISVHPRTCNGDKEKDVDACSHNLPNEKW